ncbi:MAG: L-seryl-tRNA(Sec) selenium transferase [Deltaproteobacteria bacterium]
MEKKDAFRTIPKMDIILGRDELTCLPLRQEMIKKAVEDELGLLRDSIKRGEIEKSPSAQEIAFSVAAFLTELIETGIKPMINATGVMVYTNLGRAPLSTFALMAMIDAGGYSDLEYNVKEGSRGSRQDHIKEIARAVFGVEDAIAVNNNAAAVMLVLASLAGGKEVIVSRGELVEIGGSFRMPDVMTLSGAMLKEVGTTNKTRLSDYEAAINENTGLIMKVHRSNFALIGFTDEAEIKELAVLAHSRGVPFYVDMGSGIPFDLSPFGIHGEWTVPSCLADGADIVSFSGDKVLSGPQAGIILGRKSLISRMSKHPLHRAVRIDKFSLAALVETLKLLGMEMYEELPVLRMITEDSADVRKRALRLKRRLKTGSTIIGTKAVIGGGAAPTSSIPSFAVVVSVSDSVAAHSRLREEGIVCRIEDDRLIFDMKTVSEEELKDAAERINNAL